MKRKISIFLLITFFASIFSGSITAEETEVKSQGESNVLRIIDGYGDNTTGSSIKFDEGEVRVDRDMIIPSGLTFENTTASAIRFIWKPVEETSYEVELDGDKFIEVEKNEYLYRIPKNIFEVGYRIRSKKKNKVSEWSYKKYISIKDNYGAEIEMIKPEILDVTLTNEKNESKIEVNWRGRNNFDYQIMIDSEIVNIKGESKYLLLNPKLDKEYVFKVREVKGIDASPWSEESKIVYSLNTLGKVSGLTLNEEVNTETANIVLKWNEVYGAKLYEIEYEEGNTVTSSKNEFVIEDVEVGKEYNISVRATRDSIFGEWTGVQKIIIDKLVLLETPQNLSLTMTEDKSMIVNWNAVEGAGSYELDINGEVITNIFEESYTINSCSEPVYSVRVRSRNRKQESEWSDREIIAAEDIDVSYIYTKEDLKNIKPNDSRYYILRSDIDITDENWEAIKNFKGTLDGQGYKIKGLSGEIGLFNSLYNAIVKNIIFEDVSLTNTNQWYVGALAGRVFGENAVIENIKVCGQVDIKGNQSVGGLVGEQTGGIIKDSIVEGTITGKERDTGGLVGKMYRSEVIGSNFRGTVSGKDNVGGVIGELEDGRISKSYAEVQVENRGRISGGLVGKIDGGEVEESYAVGRANGISYVGGLVGVLVSTEKIGGLIKNSFSFVDIETDEFGGGIVANKSTRSNAKKLLVENNYFAGRIKSGLGITSSSMSHDEFINNYYDGMGMGVERTEQIFGESRLTKSMITQSNYENWDFENIWAIEENKGYPYLRELKKPSEVLDRVPTGGIEVGEGTEESPYEIRTRDQLSSIRYENNKHYKLMNDMDLSDKEWKIVSNFTGVFDGQGYRIKGLRNSTSGLFNGMYNAVVKNIIFEDVSLTNTNQWYVGALAGRVFGENTVIENIKVCGQVDIKGNQSVGGLVGEQTGGIIKDSIVEGTITGKERNTGGLVGKMYRSEVIGSNFRGTVSGKDNVGGVIGELEDGRISKSYAEVQVENRGRVSGGLVGRIDGGEVEESYAVGRANGISYVGGLVGSLTSSEEIGGLIKNSFSLVDIETDEVGGGIVASKSTRSNAKKQLVENNYFAGRIKSGFGITGSAMPYDEFINNYYDGMGMGVERTEQIFGESRLTKSMIKQNNYENWDFENIWAIDENEGYPYLRELKKPSEVLDRVPTGGIEVGEGTEESPYEIRTRDQLSSIRYECDRYYKLMNDIDISGYDWKIINSFIGTLDGDGYKIKGLKNSSGGFFYSLYDALVKNIEFKDVYLVNTNQTYVGTLAGRVFGTTTIDNIRVTGDVMLNGNSHVGGLVGEQSSGNIKNSEFNGTVYGKVDYVGGIVGMAMRTNIERVESRGKIRSGKTVGGIAGRVGTNRRGEYYVRDSYSKMYIEGGTMKGGIIGYMESNAENTQIRMDNCYYDGILDGSGESSLNGVVHYSGSNNTISNSYYNSDKVENIKYENRGRTESEMMREATFNKWDFNDIWKIQEGKNLPTLRKLQDVTDFDVLSRKVNSLKLGWDRGLDENTFDINLNGKVIMIGNVESYIANNLTPGTEYEFRIRRRMGKLIGFWSNKIKGVTLLVKPEGLSVSSKSNNSNLVVWNSSENVDYYKVEINGSEIVDNIGEKYIHTELEVNTEYYYRIKAVNSITESEWTDVKAHTNLDGNEAYVFERSKIPYEDEKYELSLMGYNMQESYSLMIDLQFDKGSIESTELIEGFTANKEDKYFEYNITDEGERIKVLISRTGEKSIQGNVELLRVNFMLLNKITNLTINKIDRCNRNDELKVFNQNKNVNLREILREAL